LEGPAPSFGKEVIMCPSRKKAPGSPRALVEFSNLRLAKSFLLIPQFLHSLEQKYRVRNVVAADIAMIVFFLLLEDWQKYFRAMQTTSN
jgi:hypothetical protein